MHAAEAEGVEVRRVFSATPERLFDAWTRPEVIKRWNTRPGVTVPVAEVDLRVGGRYRLHLCGPDGTVHRVEGVYRVVEPPVRLSYTWVAEIDATRAESVVTVDFRECPGGTQVTLRHEHLPTRDSRRRHASGWSACLAQLDQVITDDERGRNH